MVNIDAMTEAARRQWDQDAAERARGEAVTDPPEPGTRWRLRHAPDITARVTKVMPRSPGGGLMFPLVEFIDESHPRPSFADHDPWEKLSTWRERWEQIVPEGSGGSRPETLPPHRHRGGFEPRSDAPAPTKPPPKPRDARA